MNRQQTLTNCTKPSWWHCNRTWPQPDYYRHHARCEDGGYLAGLADTCRSSIRELPSYPIVADAVMRHAQRVVFYQSDINLATINDHSRLGQWAGRQVSGTELNWWEIGAACGSSLAIFAHVAAAADPTLTPCEVNATEALYWPWAEALHILLDSLVDREEDRADQPTEPPRPLLIPRGDDRATWNAGKRDG